MRRPAAHNPLVFRKVARPAGTTCTEIRAGEPCGGFIRPGAECPVCACERVYIEEFIGYPEEQA